MVKEAETAHTFRQLSRLEEIASMLCNLPIKEYQLIGQYYKGLHARRIGQNVNGIFERVAEESRTYKTKALMSLAAMEGRNGNYDGELGYFTEALKTANNPSLTVEVSRCIAVVKAKEGFHQHSLKDLEKISPLLRYTNFHVRYQYYNSCSVELCEVGRLEEARNISNIVLASPYANAYPEWRETSDDIERKGYRASRSFVPIIQGLQHNIIRLPERENISVSQSQPARILHYDWKNRMVKEPNGDQTDDTSLDEMTNKDLIIEIVQRTSNKDMSENKLRKILEYVMEVESEPED